MQLSTRLCEKAFSSRLVPLKSAQLGGFDMEKCPICSGGAEKLGSSFENEPRFHFSCQLCGEYWISHPLMVQHIENYAEPYIVAGLVRNLTEEGKVVFLTTDNIADLVSSVPLPKTPFESIDLLLEYIFKKANRAGEAISLAPQLLFPIIYAKDHEEFF